MVWAKGLVRARCGSGTSRDRAVVLVVNGGSFVEFVDDDLAGVVQTDSTRWRGCVPLVGEVLYVTVGCAEIRR